MREFQKERGKDKMTCKECVHYEVCKFIGNLYYEDEKCHRFKPKSRFVELPNASDLYSAVSVLADMVNQFGYSTTFRKQEAVIDGGLSALEEAFGVLYALGCKFTSNGKITRKNLREFQERMEEEAENALAERSK